MLKCKEITKQADQYLDGELSFTQRISFKMHLALCKHCGRYVKQLSLVVNKIKKIPANYDCIDEAEVDAIYDLIKIKSITIATGRDINE